MKEKKAKTKNTAKIASIALVIGAGIGATIGLLKAPKKGQELQEDLEKQGKILWKKLQLTKNDIEKIMKDHFGEVTPQVKNIYAKTKAEILARVIKQKKNLNKTKYNQIVDTVIKQVSKSKKMKKPLQSLGKEFKKSYVEIKKALKDE